MDSTLCNGCGVPYLRRRKKERTGGGKVEAEGHSTQGEKRESKATESLEKKDFRGTEEERNNDKQLEENIGPGEEVVVDRRRSEQNIVVKTEKEWEGEREVDRERTGEELPHLGKETEAEERIEGESGVGAPFEVKLEGASEEEGEEEEEEATGGQGALQDRGGKKTKRSRSKRGVRNVEFLRGSRKRKNEEVDKTLKKKKKKKEEGNCGRRSKAEEDKWRWWEEEKRDDNGVKWHQLHHRGPYLAPPYQPLPSSVKFYYNGRPVKLSRAAEEVATFFAKMLDHDYARKKIFRDNFFCDWTQKIKNLKKCDFSDIHDYFLEKQEAQKALSKEEKQKYEVARRLKKVVHRIRCQYRADWKCKEPKKRQISVALYFIDKLALRAGNEKEEGETADTVGCCSLRVEHVALHPRQGGKENVVEFDFLGKDCIRYYNKVPVEKQVFKNLELFMEDKEPGDKLFDKLSTATLNKHLQDLMVGLTAKVFRTYNASITLQEQLEALTHANRAVALLCNHQRATPKTYEKSMKNLQAKKIEEQLAKLKFQATDKEENKQIALGTSKCKRFDVPIEKIYNKTQRAKFAWAIAMADEDFVF
ncbi:hypothetical protein Chor_010635 [Crotalus horridus]